MPNYKLTIQYDGTDYCGWQIQPNAKTVQQTLKETIEIIAKTNINLIGAGRTDTGVHALGQTANFKCEREFDIFKLNYQLNSILPKDISISKIEQVNEEFNSRFDAKSRSYIYLFSKVKNAFLYKYSWNNNSIDVKKLNELSRAIIGKQDFTSFCKKNSDTENKICDLRTIHWKEMKDFYLFYIEGDRFLHGMVRTIIGTLLEAVKTDMSAGGIKQIIESKEREAAGASAPAKGLFLYKIKY